MGHNECMTRYYAKKRALVNEAKSVPCMDCGTSYPPHVMDLDHRNPDTKLFELGSGIVSKGFEAIRAEIAKCDPVCANCHRARTFKRAL